MTLKTQICHEQQRAIEELLRRVREQNEARKEGRRDG